MLDGSARSIASSSPELRSVGGPCASMTTSPCSRRYVQRCRPTNPLAPVTRTRTSAHGRLQALEIGIYHQLDELFEPDGRLPSELSFRLGGIADQHVYFGGSDESRVDVDVFLPVQSHARESNLAELLHCVRLMRRDDVVVRLGGLQHPPDCLDVVGRIPPIATRL